MAMTISRQAIRVATLIGSALRSGRCEVGWTQAVLASRLNVSQSKISRLESGQVRLIDMNIVSEAFRLLGIVPAFERPTSRAMAPGRQHDLVHASCAAAAGRHLTRSGWEVHQEVEIGGDRYRGWIDILAYRSTDQSLLVIEIKTELHDVGAIQRTMRWYERESRAAATRLGWQPRRVTAALLLLQSSENDLRAQLNRAALKATFPGSAGLLATWISDVGPLPAWSIGMLDPRSRRREWLRPTRSDGRRSAAPYADYRDAAERIRPAPRRPGQKPAPRPSGGFPHR